ncbi:troponin T isoform X11 [Eurytemora carolleeae]|uniref:troponin T isoform X11 n=1 Tax=Eurytemora carolleeae TaxID=1294199 RepID=UPI000C787BF8|nr:troponin T isoform X11 [Eurytemora carolleeae]|eukprot:XP_023339800.1 troponin T-like isoform X11 [Eurytemora affinis]
MSDEEYYEEEEVSNTSKKGDGNFLKARQEAKKGELDEQLREYINEWRKQRAKEEEELKRLKEKQAKRKEIRAEQEKKLAQQKKEEEERLRKEEAEKKAKEAEEKRKRLEEAEKKRQAMMQAQKEKQQAGGPGKGGQKKTDGGMSNVQDARREMTKTKEQLEEEKKISLSIRIKPLELDGMDSDFLKQKASELWELIIRLETEKYDLEERQRRQDYDLKELSERQTQRLRLKAVRMGLHAEALTGKYPGWEILYCEILEKDWKEKFEDWGKKNNKAKLPKWFGERPGKKPGDPESPDDEDEGPAEVPPGAEEEEEEDEEEEEEEEEEE